MRSDLPQPDERWSAVARLAAAACEGEAAMVALRRGERFVLCGHYNLGRHGGRLEGERIFAETAKRAGQILEVAGRADAEPDSARPFRHYAGIAVLDDAERPFAVIAVVHGTPRRLNDLQRTALLMLAKSVEGILLPIVEVARPARSPLGVVAEVFARSPEPTLIYDRIERGHARALVAVNTAFTRAFRVDIAPSDADVLKFLSGAQTDLEIVGAISRAALHGQTMRATLALYPQGAAAPAWCEIFGYPVTLGDGTEIWIEQFHDVTTRIARHNEVAAERVFLSRTLASMADAVLTLDAGGRLRFMNTAARALLDVRTMQSADRLRQADERFLALRDPETEEPLARPFAPEGQAYPKKARALVLTRANERRYVEYTVSSVQRPDGTADGIVVILRDVTAEETRTRILSFEAGHDQLTGIANRRRFDQALARAIATAQGESAGHTLAFLDLDRFKAINDTCGHAAGDEVLREIAQLFKGQLRAHDVLARFGGDEFAILMHDCSPKTAARVINRIRAAIAMYRWHWQDGEFTLGVSIGLAEITRETPDAASVLAAADAACYADKAAHRNRERYIPTVGEEAPPPVSWTR